MRCFHDNRSRGTSEYLTSNSVYIDFLASWPHIRHSHLLSLLNTISHVIFNTALCLNNQKLLSITRAIGYAEIHSLTENVCGKEVAMVLLLNAFLCSFLMRMNFKQMFVLLNIQTLRPFLL